MNKHCCLCPRPNGECVFNFVTNLSLYNCTQASQHRLSLLSLGAGALKKTDDRRWAHILCAVYIPEIRFGDVTTMEPIIVSGLSPAEFNDKTCYICEEEQIVEKSKGICLTCFKPGCKVTFHVTCGQRRQLLGEEEGNEPGRVQFCGYCSLHAKKKPPKLQNSSSVASTDMDGKTSLLLLSVIPYITQFMGMFQISSLYFFIYFRSRFCSYRSWPHAR